MSISTINEKTKAEIEAIIEKMRPALYKHGGNAMLAEVGEDFVRLELQGACHGCPMSAMTFGIFLEEEIKKKVPQIKNVFYE
jgi:Fe-S cluster biogenesis protein NfuA